MHDQAAGLRHWASQRPLPVVDRTLMLFGAAQAAIQAHNTLERWHRRGLRLAVVSNFDGFNKVAIRTGTGKHHAMLLVLAFKFIIEFIAMPMSFMHH